MIPSIPQHGPIELMAHRRGGDGPEGSPAAVSAPGARAASAPGQVAKTMIAEAIAGGAELPANIQGKAASAIAHGVNMESFFASVMPVVDPPAGDDANGVSGEGESAPPANAGDDAAPAPESGAAAPPAAVPDGEATVSVTSIVASSYEIAATLLEPLVEPESDGVV